MPLLRPVRFVAATLRVPERRADLRFELRRRLGGEPPLPGGRRILVVCHGNVCRSPFAGAVLASLLPEAEVRSAGLAATDGDPADPVAARVARERFGLSLVRHRSHRATEDDLLWADLVLGMQGRHAVRICAAWPDATAKTRLLGDYQAKHPYGIPDPWGQPAEVFEAIFARIRAASERIARLLTDSAPVETVSPSNGAGT